MPAIKDEAFPIGDARKIVADLLKPKAWIYWTDTLITLTITYSCILFVFHQETAMGYAKGMPTDSAQYIPAFLFSWQAILCYVVAGFGLHRVTNMIHEVAHLNATSSLKSFRIAWNLLVGVPAMLPSYFFEYHMDHHNNTIYGTHRDGEYLSIGRGPFFRVFMFLTQIVGQPIFVLFRLLVLTPISFLHPRLRYWVLTTCSSVVFNHAYRRKISKDAPRKWWAAMDIMCCLRAWLIPSLVVLGALGYSIGTPLSRVFTILLLAFLPLSLHYFRSLTAHHWTLDGRQVSFRAQLFDSVDIVGNRFFTEFLYPVGLRYHALHHMFPTLPYHNLRTAHERLMAQLPADSPYRELVYPSVFSVLKELFQTVRSIPKQASSQLSDAA